MPHCIVLYSAEVIYEKDVKSMDIDSWENKRGPRPWEPESMKRPEDAKRNPFASKHVTNAAPKEVIAPVSPKEAPVAQKVAVAEVDKEMSELATSDPSSSPVAAAVAS